MTKEEIKKEIAECEEKLKSLREELDRPEYGGRRWKPEEGEQYYSLSPICNVDRLVFNHVYDLKAYVFGNCFKTEKEARFELERRKVIAELSDYAEDDDAVWDGRQGHYQIYYNYALNHIECSLCVIYKWVGLHFPSQEAAYAAVEAVGEERVKKYYLGVKE